MKPATEYTSGGTLRLSFNMIGTKKINDFPYNFLLTDKKVANLCKHFANFSSANIKLLKTQILKITQQTGFLSKLLGPWMKVWFQLMKKFFEPLAKSQLLGCRYS